MRCGLRHGSCSVGRGRGLCGGSDVLGCVVLFELTALMCGGLGITVLLAGHPVVLWYAWSGQGSS